MEKIRQFECFLCRDMFNTSGEPIIHHDGNIEKDDEEVSLCDDCAEEADRLIALKNNPF